MASVVAGKEGFAIVQLIELLLGPRQRIANPAGELADLLAHKKFHTVSPTLTGGHFVTPSALESSGRLIHQVVKQIHKVRGSFLVRQNVVHFLVITLDGERQTRLFQIVVDAHSDLLRPLRTNFIRDGHPQICR